MNRTLPKSDRRAFIKQISSGALLAHWSRGVFFASQKPSARMFKLAKTIKNAPVFALSPNSKYACIVYLSRTETQKLSILELGTYKEVYSLTVQRGPYTFSFFEDSERVYGAYKNEVFVINLKVGTVEKHPAPGSGSPSIGATALTGQTLLSTRSLELVKIEWPSFHVLAQTGVKGGEPKLPSNRKICIRDEDDDGVNGGKSVVCRSTEDLSLLWSRRVGSASDRHGGGIAFDISADGKVVAIVATFGLLAGTQRYEMEILNGMNGAPLYRWPVQGGVPLLSPDGTKVAIERIDTRNENFFETFVDICDVSSGRVIETLDCGDFSPGQRLAASLNSGSRFTADGRFLVTSSSLRTDFWEAK